MSMGAYKKVFLTFSSIFWPIDQPFIGLIRKKADVGDMDIPQQLGQFMQIDNLWARSGKPVMEVVLVGDGGKWSTGKSDAEIRKVVLNFIQTAMIGDKEKLDIVPLCVGCHISRWEEDKFSKGAYSGFILGTTASHVEKLTASEWDDTLMFAGEATNLSYEGSVHGALLSGREAARKIIAQHSSKVE